MLVSDKTQLLLFGDFSVEEDYLTKFLICRVCSEIFKSPMRLMRCGHTFCNACITAKTCYLCNQTYQTKQQDLIASNLVSDLIVKCAVKDCPYKGTYEQYLRSHKNKCKLKQFGGLEGWMKEMRKALNKDGKDDQNKRTQEDQYKNQIQMNNESFNNNLIGQEIPMEQNRSREKVNEKHQLQNFQLEEPSYEFIEPIDLQKRHFYDIVESEKCQFGQICGGFAEGKCLLWHPKEQPSNYKERTEKYQLKKWAQKRIRAQANKKGRNLQRLKRCFSNTQNFLKEYFPNKYRNKQKGNEVIEIQQSNIHVIEL